VAGHAPDKSRPVEYYIGSIGQTFLKLGHPDSKLKSSGNVNFHIKLMLSAYTKEDPPPNRVKPIAVPILCHIFHVADTMNNVHA